MQNSLKHINKNYTHHKFRSFIHEDIKRASAVKDREELPVMPKIPKSKLNNSKYSHTDNSLQPSRFRKQK